jgi:hypothetical protein
LTASNLHYDCCITTDCLIKQARKVLLEDLDQLVPDGAINFGSAFDEVINDDVMFSNAVVKDSISALGSAKMINTTF